LAKTISHAVVSPLSVALGRPKAPDELSRRKNQSTQKKLHLF
jgi:hypothetical protein